MTARVLPSNAISPQFMFHRPVCKNEEHFIPKGLAYSLGEVWGLSSPSMSDVSHGAAQALAWCLSESVMAGSEALKWGWGPEHDHRQSMCNSSWEGTEKAE